MQEPTATIPCRRHRHRLELGPRRGLPARGGAPTQILASTPGVAAPRARARRDGSRLSREAEERALEALRDFVAVARGAGAPEGRGGHRGHARRRNGPAFIGRVQPRARASRSGSSPARKRRASVSWVRCAASPCPTVRCSTSGAGACRSRASAGGGSRARSACPSARCGSATPSSKSDPPTAGEVRRLREHVRKPPAGGRSPAPRARATSWWGPGGRCATSPRSTAARATTRFRACTATW